MANTISTDFLVHTVPGVVEGQGAALSFNGLLLTDSTKVPIGTLLGLATPAAVLDYFGVSSAEYALAQTYFKGFDGSTVKPGLLYFWQFARAAVKGYLRGGSMKSVTLDQIKAMSGVLTLTVDGVTASTASINLTAATSQSNAAAIITTALTAAFPVELPVCTYDSIQNAFVITSSVTGTISSISFGTGAIAPLLKLDAANGAVRSPGAAIATPAGDMTMIDALSRGWASFFKTWESTISEDLLFAAWVNTSTNYAYLPWTDDPNTISTSDTTSLAYLLNGITIYDANGNPTELAPATNDYDNTMVVWNNADMAAALSGFMASINVNQPGGWIDFAYLAQSGLASTVNNRTDAQTLESKRVMFLGDFASRTTGYKVTFPGAVSGIFDWLNDFLGNTHIRSQLETAWMSLRTQRKSMSYTESTYSLIRQVFSSTVFEPAKVLGAVNAGVFLDDIQKTTINSLTGSDDAATQVEQQGYFIHIVPPTAATRNARKLDINTWYTSGGSINRLNISVFNVQ